MNTVSDIWRAWTTAAQINPPPSLNDATDILQTFAVVDDATGDAWWNAVTAEFNRLQLINQPTYVQLRNFVDGNESGANELFDALLASINFLPETALINEALALGNNAAQLAEIDGNIADITALKTGGTSVKDIQFDTALDEAIRALEQFRNQLTQ